MPTPDAIGPLADRFERSRFGVEEGLPQASVVALEQDLDGYLWLGTFGGLARFDGRRFAVFGYADGVGSPRITALSLDRDSGELWIGTQYGAVFRMGPSLDVEAVPVPDLERSTVWAFELSGSDPVVVASRGLSVADGAGGWRTTPLHDGRAAARTREGLRVATYDGVVDEAGRVVAPGHTVALVVDGDGAVWTSGAFGVRRGADAARPLPSGGAGPIRVDRARHLWVGHGSRVSVWADAERVAAGEAGPETEFELGAPVRSLFEDRAGSVWVGTDGGGVVRFRALPFERFGAGGVSFVDAAETPRWGSQCELWGPAGRLEVPEALRCVSASLRAGGHDWLGDGDGALAQDGVIVDRLGAAILALATDPAAPGSLWVGTSGRGAFRGPPGALVPVPGLEREVVSFVGTDPGGRTWLGLLDGVAIVTPGGLTRLGPDDGLGVQVRSAWFDPGGSAVLGTYGGGLAAVSADLHVRLLGADVGLRDAVSSALVEDGHGNLWSNGNRGVTWLSVRELRDVVLGRQPELRAVLLPTGEGNGGAMPAGGRAADGALWWPTVHGAVRLDPARWDASPPPRPIVEEVQVPGVAPVRRPTRVVSGGRLDVRFTAPVPEGQAVEFRYRVRPTLPDWVVVGEARQVALADLGPGEHVVDVSVRSASSGWSAPASLSVSVPATWSESLLVRFLVPLSVASATAAFLLWRILVNRRRASALEREVAERARLEEVLRASEAHYRRVFDAATNPIVVISADGVVQDANPAATALYGGTAGVVGMPARHLFAGDVFVTHDGTRIPVRVESVSDGGRELRTFVDVTSLDELQRQLVRTERAEAVGRTAGAVAHDFNNLLAVIRANALEVQPLVEGTPGAESVSQVLSATERGADLLRQLLAAGRRQVLQPQVVDVGTALREAVARTFSMKPGNVRIRVSTDRGTTVRVDPDQLELALLTLLLHTFQRLEGRGSIQLSTSRWETDWVQARWGVVAEHAWVVTAAVDDGPTLPPSVTARLFEPFVEDAGRPGGVLGFSAIHGFVTQSGGHLFVRSEPGRGTSFEILLPHVDGDPRPPPSPDASGPLRILVVDDEPLVRRALVRMLESFGHQVRSAASGAEALAAMDEEEPQVLISDVLMPHMTGPELVARTRADHPGVRVVYVTAYAQEHVGTLDAPVVAKPFERAALESALLRARRSGGP